MPKEINNLIASIVDLRKKRTGLFSLYFLLLSCSISVFFLSFAVLLDLFSAGLNSSWRCFFLGLFLSSLLSAFVWLFFLVRKPLSNQAMAALIEQAYPEFNNTLINALQFHETAQHPPAMISAVLRESPVGLSSVKVEKLYSARLPLFAKRSVSLLLLFWVVLFFASGHSVFNSTKRIFLPFADLDSSYATIIDDLQPGTTVLRKGQELSVELKVSGRLPVEASLIIDQKGRKQENFSLQSDPEDVSFFSGSSRALFENCRYRVRAGDNLSPWYNLQVLSPPTLTNWHAKIIPPDSTAMPAFDVNNAEKNLAIPIDSMIILKGKTSEKINKIQIKQGSKTLHENTFSAGNEFLCQFQVTELSTVQLYVFSEIEGNLPLPFVIVPDLSPIVKIKDTELKNNLPKGENFPISFLAEDDYVIARVGLEQIKEQGEREQLQLVMPENDNSSSFAGRFIIDTGSFQSKRTEVLKFRVWAEDKGRNPEKRRGYSAIVELTFSDIEESREEKNEKLQNIAATLTELIKLQSDNLKDSRRIADLAMQKLELSQNELTNIEEKQKLVRTTAIELLQHRESLGSLAEMLYSLINGEMLEALQIFEYLYRTDNKTELLLKEVQLQNKILASLKGLNENIQKESLQSEKRDFFAFLQKLIKKQRENLLESKNYSEEKDIELSALIHNQDEISEGILAFLDLCIIQAEATSADDDFAILVRNSHKFLSDKSTYEQSIKAAEALEDKDFPSALTAEKNVLSTLLNVLDLLNQWRVSNARKILSEASEVLHSVHEELLEIEKKQANITEVTRDLMQRGKLDEQIREELGKMDREQEEMADLLEKLANDLYQFPELPICNELNSRMREIYESVLQAMDSENTPAIEIAVQKEDALLDLIRSTVERIEDVEMWLPDIPDNIVWNMESFDVDEFPEIPLVPLPDELEDLVGDLLEQAAEIEMESQDTTGNNIIADMEMGWAVMDGPMPSFSAKGKSGNTRPNDNEMTGRSGAGREGQSSGELVESHVKGYEGRQSKARRTQDPFQKGMLTEDEDSTLKARATGGGKLGGESESIGMFANSVRRDLHTGSHSANLQRIRQETEALYASSRLLYLGSGSLGEAASELRNMENASTEIKELGNLHKRVLRRLVDTQVEMKDGIVLSMPTASLKKDSGGVVELDEWGKVADEYKPLLNEYYRSLQE